MAWRFRPLGRPGPDCRSPSGTRDWPRLGCWRCTVSSPCESAGGGGMRPCRRRGADTGGIQRPSPLPTPADAAARREGRVRQASFRAGGRPAGAGPVRLPPRDPRRAQARRGLGHAGRVRKRGLDPNPSSAHIMADSRLNTGGNYSETTAVGLFSDAL